MKPRTRALLSLCAFLLVGLTVATQVAAKRLPRRHLGPHLRLGDLRVYPPWSMPLWHSRWNKSAPSAFRSAKAILAAHAAGGALVAAAIHSLSPAVRPVGRRHWAKPHHLRRAGLMARTGVVVGLHRGRVLAYGGPEHQLVVGASRSGKGVGSVIPTLLSWPASAVVYDIKQELWHATAGWRSRFSHCMFFDPTSADSARYNPLAEVRKGAHEIRDAQNIAELLVDPDGAKQHFDVWDLHAKQLLTAVILHVLYTEPDHRKHLAVVREHLLDLKAVLRDMIELPHRCCATTGAPESHPEVARVAKEMLRQAPKFVAGVAATAQSYLSLFADEMVARSTAASDFTVGDLVCTSSPVTLYLQPPPSDVPRLRPLMRLVLNQVCRGLLERLDTDGRGRPKRHQLLLELDEFATLGRMEFFSTNLRQMAGYGIKAHMIVQSFNDLIERYGPHQSIIDNCHVITVFACADTVTQQRVSQMTGVALEYRDSFGHRRWPRVVPDSLHQGEQARPLLQPGDVRAFPPDEQLVFVTGFPPMRSKKLRYYRDRRLRRRVLSAPEQQEQIDVPRHEDWSDSLGVPHDWLGERPKGERIPSDEIFESSQLDDEEWMPPTTLGSTDSADGTSTLSKDDYAL